MINITTLKQTSERHDVAFAGALHGVSPVIPGRVIAYVDAPSTGEVRPKAADVRSTRLDGPATGDDACVRTWSPPV